MSQESDVQEILNEAGQGTPAELPADSATVDQEAPEGEATGQPEPVESPEVTEVKKQVRGVQKRLNELTQRAKDAEENAKAWQTQAFNVAQVLQQAKTQPAAPVQEITPQQFTSYEAYLEAKTAKAATEAASNVTQQIVNQRLNEQQQAQQQAQLQSQAQAVLNQAQANINTARPKYQDFDEVIEDGSRYLQGPGSAAVMLAVAASPVGGDMLYHLSKNPQLAQRIAGSHELIAMNEMGKLEAMVNATGKQVSSAPKPGKPAGSRTNPVGTFREDMTWKEFDQLLKTGWGSS